MKTSIKLVVFDMAGTTVNENNVVYKTLQKAINNAGANVSLDFVLKHGAGKEKHQAIKDILNNLESLDKKNYSSINIFEDFKTLLNLAYINLEVSPCHGVEQLFTLLKKAEIKIALNTGYNSAVANTLLNKLNWKQGYHYDTLITASDVDKGRPHPDMIYKAMKDLNIANTENVLKVGDSIIDIEEGKNASCGVTIGVTTGAHTRNQLKTANPTYIFDSILELKKILA
ncbi:phosphonatase-like hydrolase [Algibacter sp. PT7-4]|uniref:phosphonatase-like hydrolase n=1 Tax=Algibacter ulvanivorans TaxID=3400999 RepID=UPI003AABD64E